MDLLWFKLTKLHRRAIKQACEAKHGKGNFGDAHLQKMAKVGISAPARFVHHIRVFYRAQPSTSALRCRCAHRVAVSPHGCLARLGYVALPRHLQRLSKEGRDVTMGDEVIITVTEESLTIADPGGAGSRVFKCR